MTNYIPHHYKLDLKNIHCFECKPHDTILHPEAGAEWEELLSLHMVWSKGLCGEKEEYNCNMFQKYWKSNNTCKAWNNHNYIGQRHVLN